jgi:hypothetical protein
LRYRQHFWKHQGCEGGRASFLTVAKEFNITQENAPTNAAFIKHADLMKMRARGIAMFGLFEDEAQIGFVAIERADGGVFYPYPSVPTVLSDAA